MSTVTGFACLLVASLQSAGGSDSCATPEVIAGQGTFAFDLTSATTGTEGQNEPLCLSFGSTAIHSDVWFEWTSPRTGRVRLNTCSLTSVDTRVAVYPGSGCPADGTSVACADDTCGFQSAVEWDATFGATYTIQLGAFPGAATGTGAFELFIGVDPAHNVALAGTASQSTTDFGGVASRGNDGNTDGIYNNGSCTHTANSPDSWWEVDLGGTMPVSRVLLYNRLDCCDTRLSNFRVSVFDGAVEVFGQDDYVNTGSVPANGIHVVAAPTGTAGDRVRVKLLGLNNDGNGILTLAEVEVESDGAGASYCFGDGSGLACPCGNTGAAGLGCANSGGPGGLLTGAGSESAAADDLAFNASGLLAGQPALLFVGVNAINGGDGVPFGDGLRCAGGSVVRLGVQVPSANGDASWGPGLGAAGGWSAGDVRRFQGWYRDPAGPCGLGFNLTNGVEVQFTP